LRIWAAAILLAFLIPIVAVTTANSTHEDHATPVDHSTRADHESHPNTGNGTITFTQSGTVSGPTVLNHHTIIASVKEKLSFTGNITGTALTIERVVMHNITDEGKTIIFTTFHGWGNFTGTLGSNSVTLHMRYEGVVNSTFARGNFVVSGDTGQNAGVHGEGHFRGSLTVGEGGSTVNYTMHWTVATHTEHPEARDKDRERD
jgi:hypothetical protein